jgi:signal transduction histidine kinase/DNA-binding response OmpR family regulator
MAKESKNIPLKVLFSYLVITGLVFFVGYLLFKENAIFQNQEKNTESESRKLIQMSNLISQIYKVDNLSRVFTQTNQIADFDTYTKENDKLIIEIDSLQTQVDIPVQIQFLDSLKLLLFQKVSNIKELEQINKTKASVIPVEKALNSIKGLEAVKGKLTLENFVKNPSKLTSYEKRVAQEYIDYLNANVPRDATNSFSPEEVDSILNSSKLALEEVLKNNETRNETLKSKEIELLKNDIHISQSINRILTDFEVNIVNVNQQNSIVKEKSQARIFKILKYSSILGLGLTAVFFFLITNDFLKNQRFRDDLEQEKLKTESLLQSREQLIATVSHDLKTPLNTIQGYSELLLSTTKDEKQQHYLTTIKNSSNYINQLVNDLLDYSRLEAGKITVEKSEVRLDLLIAEIMQSVQGVYKNKSLNAILQLDAVANKTFLGDGLKTRQILTNLVGNAFKFTENGFVKVTAYLKNANIELIVEDSGIGIDKAHHQHVFQEFTQADASIEKRFGGTGLGLTICKKLAHFLGGTLILESEFGKGSKFILNLPMQEVEGQELNKIALIPNQSPKNIKAILVDDDAGLLQLTSEILKLQEIKVNAFTSAREALLYAQNNDFSIVITDIQMPGIDGFEFVKQLKSEVKRETIPVIAITGRSDLNKEIYLEAGFSKILQKPYQSVELLSAINEVLSTNFEIVSAQILKSANKNLYNLDSLKYILHNDREALVEVLQAFLKSNDESLQMLNKSVVSEEYDQIETLAHKMIPMLVQIEANEIASELKKLENWKALGLNPDDIDVSVRFCNEKLSKLFENISIEIT